MATIANNKSKKYIPGGQLAMAEVACDEQTKEGSMKQRTAS
ncbi:hypothetical protein FVEN_g12994 [Fusarium venenatum]|nr:hypothetical protein FVEN_g12994 [Fusarium venenatum]